MRDKGGRGAEVELRAQLLAQEKTFFNTMVSTMLGDGPEFGRYADRRIMPTAA